MYRCLLVSEKWQDYSSSLTSKSWDSWLVLSHLETNVVSSSGFLTRQSFLSVARKWKCPNMTDTAVHDLFFGRQRRSRRGTNMSILTIQDEIYSIPLTKKRNMITKFRNTNLSWRKWSVIFVLNKNNGRFSWGVSVHMHFLTFLLFFPSFFSVTRSSVCYGEKSCCESWCLFHPQKKIYLLIWNKITAYLPWIWCRAKQN